MEEENIYPIFDRMLSRKDKEELLGQRGVMLWLTGLSGSGKSTLVRDIFFRALKRELDECSERPGEFASIGGDLQNLRNVEFVDQNPIGKSRIPHT